ncbi:MAG: carboxymuconolactone decarboxylase family protein [Proteobacteria bacterium]|nr:carboxymuconolactone decarboxylase family protein [Burkholderiales bacterium]
MARVAYAEEAEQPELAQRIRAQRGGKMLNLYRMLMNSPALAEGWLALLTAIRQQCALPARYRELAILRVAVVNEAPYEFAAHVPFARAEGINEAQIEGLRTLAVGAVDTQAPLYDETMRAVIAYADSMTREIHVPDAVFAQVSRHFDAQQMVELTATVGAYNMVSRFLEALQMDPETAA